MHQLNSDRKPQADDEVWQRMFENQTSGYKSMQKPIDWNKVVQRLETAAAEYHDRAANSAREAVDHPGHKGILARDRYISFAVVAEFVDTLASALRAGLR